MAKDDAARRPAGIRVKKRKDAMGRPAICLCIYIYISIVEVGTDIRAREHLSGGNSDRPKANIESKV